MVRDMVDLTEVWPRAVDPWLAARSWPLALKEGRLTVGTDDPAIAHHLTLASGMDAGDEDGQGLGVGAQVVDRLNELLGRELITDIRFKTAARPGGGRTAKKHAGGDPRTRPAPEIPPLDAIHRARLERKAARVRDPELKEALLKLVRGL